MYNENMKEEFIKDYMQSRVVAQTSLYSLFRKVEPYEQDLNKDCSEFTEEEILKMYKEFAARSHNVLLNYNVILKAYCAWKRHYHGLENDIAYESITIEMVRALISDDAKRVLTREEITEIEDQLYNWSDKAIVELLFVGVAGKNMEDMYSISEECIKGDLLIVNGKEFPLTDRLKELLPRAFSEIEITSYGDTMKIIPVNGKGRIYKERANAKGIDTDDAKFRYFYRKIQLFRDYLGIPGLTMKNITASGLWHCLSRGMEATNLDLRSFLRTEAGEQIAVRYGFSKDYYVENVYAKCEQYL
jgi:hypothetical protein